MTTCRVTVGEFLEVIFAEYNSDLETPVLGQTRRRPSDDTIVYWAYRWASADLLKMHHASLALQKPTEPHQTSRKANFKGGVGLVLDDVFEKARAPLLEPTWKIETKPGSEQWGYLFDQPLRDPILHDQMIRALIENGLSDPGMRNVVRWFRLPGSKPLGKEHAALLVHWRPERRFPNDKLLAALGILSLPRPRCEAIEGSSFTPDDPVWNWLNTTGQVRNLCADGWWEVTCPRAEEHSTSDSRAYYLPIGGPNQRRGFNCFHSHKISVSQFLRWVAHNGGPMVSANDCGDMLRKAYIQRKQQSSRVFWPGSRT